MMWVRIVADMIPSVLYKFLTVVNPYILFC